MTKYIFASHLSGVGLSPEDVIGQSVLVVVQGVGPCQVEPAVLGRRVRDVREAERQPVLAEIRLKYKGFLFRPYYLLRLEITLLNQLNLASFFRGMQVCFRGVEKQPSLIHEMKILHASMLRS